MHVRLTEVDQVIMQSVYGTRVRSLPSALQRRSDCHHIDSSGELNVLHFQHIADSALLQRTRITC